MGETFFYSKKRNKYLYDANNVNKNNKFKFSNKKENIYIINELNKRIIKRTDKIIIYKISLYY